MGGMPQPPDLIPPPPVSPLAPLPGLPIFLIVLLAIAAVITGLLTVFGTVGVAGGTINSGDVTLAAAFAVLFAASVVALVGVVTRAPWSRWAAILAGVAFTMTCLGSVLGIPIIVAAARASDLSPPRAV